MDETKREQTINVGLGRSYKNHSSCCGKLSIWVCKSVARVMENYPRGFVALSGSDRITSTAGSKTIGSDRTTACDMWSITVSSWLL